MARSKNSRHGHQIMYCRKRGCVYLRGVWCCSPRCHVTIEERARAHNARLVRMGAITSMRTLVVNMKREDHDVRIDRRTKWRNPFFIGKDGSRREVIDKYRKYFLGRVDLLRDLEELRGMRLGCWCAPLPCHGDVLVEFIMNGVPWRRVPKKIRQK